ncbi:hypothetical protein DFH07DRAFT_961019 [Mycena maculata]|uniref:DNA replication regulator SLD2 n=1 Tax=Mycena maculata TaxID=230809 RepID=A0AAD7IVB8_9AGAR|nr:hypothetical protein DFH07DRAFT_961019 [Mycena maculata]
MDVSALRTEIKGWERSFRATHGRTPTIQDIKEQPGLAEKYRKYKKLSKGGDSAASTKSSNPPSTPPRSRSQSCHSTHPSLLLSKSRPVTTTQPLPGYNPFSPQKNKGKQKASSPDVSSKANPFRLARDPSPNPGAPILFFSTSSATGDPFAPTSNNPVLRARKRLRGEPVSPSPNKEKRRRIVSDESDDDDDRAANTSFVDDSPIKPPNGVRSFKLLFEEAEAKPKFPQSRSTTLPTGLFREKAVLAEETDKMDVDGDHVRSVEKKAATTSLGPHVVMDQDNPFLESVERADSPASDGDVMADRQPSSKPQSIARNLLAPSPPPANQRASGKSHNGKGRGKPASEGRKQGKASGSDDARSDEDVEIGNGAGHKVRLFDRHASHGRVREDNGLDEDAYYLTARRPPDIHAVQPEISESISVPDTLLSILSLAPTPSHERRDEDVVGQLLYGARKGHYDPSKGGEIWGVGEFEEQDRDEFPSSNGQGDNSRAPYDDEDDWEGEGVPWEVGEL